MKKLLALLLALTAIATVAVSCSEKADTKSTGVMTYTQYIDAAVDTDVVVETYVQAKTSLYQDKTTLYTQDKDGAYFVYDLEVTQAEFDKLKTGTKIKVTGKKAVWDGEVEIIDAKIEILSGTYTAKAFDATSLLGKADLSKHQNEFFTFKNLTVVASTDGDGNEVPFLYKWNGAGQRGDDVYFKVSDGTTTLSVLIRTYIENNGSESAAYKAAESLKVGDKVDIEGFLYWYLADANPHITKVTKK